MFIGRRGWCERIKTLIEHWIKCSKAIVWKKLCPELKTDGKLECFEDLMRIDLKIIIDAL